MRAYRFDDFNSLEDLRIRDEDDPRPQRGEVLARVRSVSLNFRDIAMLRGRYPQPYRKGLIPLSDDEAAQVVTSVDEFAAWAIEMLKGRGVTITH